jgi:hypothetical protein
MIPLLGSYDLIPGTLHPGTVIVYKMQIGCRFVRYNIKNYSLVTATWKRNPAGSQFPA